MTPQSTFMVNATIAPGKRAELEALLETMNQADAPGSADPMNALLPFGEFGTLHFARFVIMDDQTVEDFKFWNLPPPEYRVSLVFLGDCDGPGDALLAAFVEHDAAAAGLRRIFAHCEGFDSSTDLLAWMRQHSVRALANYVNWIGRTVLQVHKEAALRAKLQRELATYVQAHPNAGDDVRHLRDHLRSVAQQHPELIPARTRTPVGWAIGNALHWASLPGLLILSWALAIPAFVCCPVLAFWVAAPFAVLAALAFLYLIWVAPVTFAVLVAAGITVVPVVLLCPPLLLLVVIFVFVLRHYEKGEPNVIPVPTIAHDNDLARREDHNITNQYSLVASIKPSAFRRMMFVLIVWTVNWGSRHIYNRGYLARIQTIHFARWVPLDGSRRAFFYTNYDGSHQSYMDDFINKIGWGLNIMFSHGMGYPRTNWLVLDGAEDEQRFKDANRRHQIATQVWYNAYPGLTALDLGRNTRVRKGLQRRWMRKSAIRAWLRDL